MGLGVRLKKGCKVEAAMKKKRVSSIKIVKMLTGNKGKKNHQAMEVRKGLLDELQDSDYAAYYLSNCLDEDGVDGFLRALGDVVKALGGIAKVAKRSELSQQSLYGMLSPSANPPIRNLVMLLDKIGVGVSFFAIREAA